MCGILGWAGIGAPNFDTPTFEGALRQLAHRGPDDQGIWSEAGVLLGHRRLSIIDLTTGGHQPMPSSSGRSHIVYNGEIYNYVELRRELEQARVQVKGKSDTAVLLEMLESRGLQALQSLNGMFAFAWWDSTKRRLMLCRDRFGVKPLYYCVRPEGIAFASEPKALLALYPEYRNIDKDTLLQFLDNNELYSHGGSFYAGIRVLPPAHYAIFDTLTNSLKIERYWDYPHELESIEQIDPMLACEQFDALFNDAVRIRMRSDVPVGLTLSGGLDSSAILAGAARHSATPLRCYTSVYGDDSGAAGAGEHKWALLASQTTGASLTSVSAPRGDWLQVMKEITWHMDGPGYSPAVYPMWNLMKQAKADGVPVLLEGQGSDEALAGYPRYAVLELLMFLRQGGWAKPGSLSARLQGLHGTFSWRWALAWIARESFPGLLAWHRQRTGFKSLLRKGVELPSSLSQPTVGGNAVTQRLRIDHSREVLPGLLHYGDAISMAHSVETRQPFMDYRLVEWMFRAPTSIKLNEGQTKWVLREYLRSHNLAAIGNRRDKKGYPTPVSAWLASEEGRYLESKVLRPSSPLHEWCDPVRLARLFEFNRKGVMGSEHHLYKLVSTQMWMDRCLITSDVA
jgi:asparagine synthase (glutamine-hydrolysing)